MLFREGFQKKSMEISIRGGGQTRSILFYFFFFSKKKVVFKMHFKLF